MAAIATRRLPSRTTLRPRGFGCVLAGVYRAVRKTTPKVRGGRVQKKNRWERSEDPDDKVLSNLGINFETRAPGPGRRHVVTEIDVRRFVRCIPDWEAHAEGLRAMVLGDFEDCLGSYDGRGIIYLSSWDQDLFWDADPEFFEEHKATLLRLGVPSDACRDDGVPLYFDERSARAFQLVHIFLHELGHHRDMRISSGRGKPWLTRGDEFAESWALQMEELVWPRYKEFFGAPGQLRIAPEAPEDKTAPGATEEHPSSGERHHG